MNKITLAQGVLSTPTAKEYNSTDKSKEWQMELLMEKLRSKANQLKPFAETSKNVRMAMLDKRYALDSVEKAQHQKCLDTLQHCIKVTSLQSMIERLESLTRQLNLNFMVGPSGVELFISSDMFYLEIVLDPTGAVKDVKVHHEGKMEQQSCAELVNCLSRGDFADFTAQLEGFASIYQLEIEKKVKCKAFTALQSLETDLNTLAQLQTFIQEPSNLLHKSPVGILQKRRGGHAMKLTYFVSPYDLIDKEHNIAEPLSVDIVTSKNLGYSVTVCMEGSGVHKLQTATIISVSRNPNGKNTPSYATLGSQNSAQISACFVLRLNKPLPMCVSLAKKIQQVTELPCGDDTNGAQPLLSLITQHCSDGQLDGANNKGLFVTLPDQHHCYFLTENKNMDGILIKSIPFTHPSHVPQILVLLRQQALFNTVISSCIRPWSKQDLENMIMFEITALSWQHISISLEHPLEETMATAELDLSDISNVNCRIFSSGSPVTDGASDVATKVFQTCLSVPITMRSVIKLWDTQVRKNNHSENENFSLPLGAGDPGGHGRPGGNEDNNLHQSKSDGSNLGTGMGQNMSHPHQGMFLNETLMSGVGFNPFPGHQGSMLSNMELTNILAGGASSSEKAYSKRQHKRKSSGDLWKGSSKRKASGAEDNDVLLESSSSDSTSRSTPISHETASETGGIATPNSALGFHSDLEISGLDAGDVEKASSDADDEDVLKGARKTRSERKSPSSSSSGSVLLDFTENKNLVPPSVSITPIPTSVSQSFNSGIGLERRPGIEIIPISSAPPTSLPSSITITPISTSQMKAIGEERSKEKKSSKSSRGSDDKSRLEKKRKRKREESHMGPPEKVPPKNDPLSKPVSVSIRAAESPPLPAVSPASPSAVIRKFNASPTHSRGLSPSLLKPMGKSSGTHHSPKHSPAHGISSPKNHGTSPKHPSTGTGKPSISTLKSAANSPSSKTNDSVSGSRKSISSSKETSSSSFKGDKESKKSSSSNVFSVSPSKSKPSSAKLKPVVDLSVSGQDSGAQGGDAEQSPSAGGADSAKSAGVNQLRNRKGSLSAVIDKLKNAQHCGSESEGAGKGAGSRDARPPSKTVEGKGSTKVGSDGGGKNSEYMVKASSDAMKITINKTKSSKSSSGSLSKSQSFGGTGSPKTHTGLKPGVNSGPASKKPQQPNQKSSSVVSSSNSTGSSYVKNSSVSSSGSGNKTSSSSSVGSSSFSGSKSLSGGGGLSKSLSKLSSSPKSGSGASATDLSGRNKDRSRLSKSSEKSSIFSNNSLRKSSPTASETDSERAYKLFSSKMDQYPSSLMVEGLIKQLDTKFQIPKLSARTAAEGGDKKPANKTAVAEGGGATSAAPPVLNNSNMQRTDKMFSDMVNKSGGDVALPKYNIAKSLENVDGVKNMRNSAVSTPVPANSVPFSGSVSPKTTKKDYLGPVGGDDSSAEFNSDGGSAGDGKGQSAGKTYPCASGGGAVIKDDAMKMDAFPPISASSKSFAASSVSALTSASQDSLNLSVKSNAVSDCGANKFAVPQGKSVAGASDSAAKISAGNKESTENDLLLDFSATGKSVTPVSISAVASSLTDKAAAVKNALTASPLVSPACITDDDLMDEALLGIGK